MRRFNKDWFKSDQYGSWLEYSIENFVSIVELFCPPLAQILATPLLSAQPADPTTKMSFPYLIHVS